MSNDGDPDADTVDMDVVDGDAAAAAAPRSTLSWNAIPETMPRRPRITAQQANTRFGPDANASFECMYTRRHIIWSKAAHKYNRYPTLALLGTTREGHSVTVCNRHVRPYFYIQIADKDQHMLTADRAGEFLNNLNYMVRSSLAYAAKPHFSDNHVKAAERRAIAAELRIEAKKRGNRRWVEQCTWVTKLPLELYTVKKRTYYRIQTRNIWIQRFLVSRFTDGVRSWMLVDKERIRRKATADVTSEPAVEAYMSKNGGMLPIRANARVEKACKRAGKAAYNASEQVYKMAECNLAFVVQVISDFGVFCNTWLELLAGSYTLIPRRSRRRYSNRQLEVHCRELNVIIVHSHDEAERYNDYAPIRILSWDGEMRAHKKGLFVDAEVDPLIHLGAALREDIVGLPHTHATVGCVGACNAIPHSNTDIVQCSNEPILLILTVYMLSHLGYDASILTGWNMDIFDMPYIYKRIFINFGSEDERESPLRRIAIKRLTEKGILPPLPVGARSYEDAPTVAAALLRFFPKWATLRARAEARGESAADVLMGQMTCFVRGKICDHRGKLVPADRATSTKRVGGGGGCTTVWFPMIVPGVQNVDGLRLHRKMKSGKHGLKAVAKKAFGKSIVEMDYELIPETHQQSLDHPENPKGNTQLAKYTLSDVFAPHDIADHFAWFAYLFEKGRKCGISAGELTSRGTGICSTMLLRNYANIEGMLFPQRPLMENSDPILGGNVLEPIEAFHRHNVVTLDFASLYPSIVRAFNICWSTLIDIRNHNTTIEATLKRRKLRFEDIHVTPKAGVYFVKKHVREGVLPKICDNLTHTRVAVKCEIVTLGAQRTVAAAAGDDVAVAELTRRLSILNERQLSLKLLSNALYGFTADPHSPIPNRTIAEIITTFGMHLCLQSASVTVDHATRGFGVLLNRDLVAHFDWATAYHAQRERMRMPIITRLGVQRERLLRGTMGRAEPPLNISLYTEPTCTDLVNDFDAIFASQHARTRAMYPDTFAKREADTNADDGAGDGGGGGRAALKQATRRKMSKKRLAKLAIGSRDIVGMFSTAAAATTATTATAAADRPPRRIHQLQERQAMDIDAPPRFLTPYRAAGNFCLVDAAARARFFSWCALCLWTKKERATRPLTTAEAHGLCEDSDQGHAAVDAFLTTYRPGGDDGASVDYMPFLRSDLDAFEPPYRWEQTAIIVYGDTDSIMVKIKDVPLHVAHVLAFKLQFILNIYFAPLISIIDEYEKVYSMYDLREKKKRYAGALYKPWSLTMDRVDSKGSEIARGDNCPMLIQILKHLTKLIFIEENLTGVLPYLVDIIGRIYAGDFDMSMFIVGKKFSKPLIEYKMLGPHLKLVQRMQKRDMASAPTPGDCVEFIYITHFGKSGTGDRTEDPNYALTHNLVPDYHYYVQNTFLNPIIGTLGRLFTKRQILTAFSGKHVNRRSVVFHANDTTLRNAIVARNRCAVCRSNPAAVLDGISFAVCGDDACWDGLAALQDGAEKKSKALHDIETDIWDECGRCCAPSGENPENCANKACELFYKRREARHKSNTAQDRARSIYNGMHKRDTFERTRGQVAHTSARDIRTRPERDDNRGQKRRHIALEIEGDGEQPSKQARLI
jgi:DNA polymerase elongation subunit (family B)